MKNRIVSLLIAAGLTLGASQAFAAPYNATIADLLAGAGFGGGPYGIGAEDNETEPGTIASQAWDMEAFVVNGSSIYIVGGYNMQAGEAGNGGLIPGMLTPGDLFIKVGGSAPTAAPLTESGPTVTNAGYGYDYVVDLTQPVGATGATAAVYAVTSSSVFDTVIYDQFGANPWRYNGGGTLDSNRAITYTSNLGNGDAALVALGLGGLTGGSHNILQVDLGFLVGQVGPGVPVYFSYTMECGNDSLKGQYGGGFDRNVPDSSASVLLIGLGLAAMATFGLKRRR